MIYIFVISLSAQSTILLVTKTKKVKKSLDTIISAKHVQIIAHSSSFSLPSMFWCSKINISSSWWWFHDRLSQVVSRKLRPFNNFVVWRLFGNFLENYLQLFYGNWSTSIWKTYRSIFSKLDKIFRNPITLLNIRNINYSMAVMAFKKYRHTSQIILNMGRLILYWAVYIYSLKWEILSPIWKQI